MIKFIAICLISFCFDSYGAYYTKHEKRFYENQIKFIKKSWAKLIKNESEEFVDTSTLIKKTKDLKTGFKSLKKCKEAQDCEITISSLLARLSEIENECLKVLTGIGELELSIIEKYPNRYTAFIKKISDIINNISMAKNLALEKSRNKLQGKNWQEIVEKSSEDLILHLDNLHFQINSIPQITIKKSVSELLNLGQTEYISQLDDELTTSSDAKFHSLDKTFNGMNRDLLKSNDLLSSGSKSYLLQIHQRWNAILKIVKKK